MQFLKKPVDQEFFTKFTAIFSRDETGNAKAVRLTNTSLPQSSTEGYIVYCDKIRIGEIIDTAIQRTVTEEFGLTLIDYYVNAGSMDVDINKIGIPITRIPVVAYVTYGSFKKSTLAGCTVSWVDRDTYDYACCEALQWIQRNDKSVLFDLEEHNVDRVEMIEFVKNLYAAGAIDITLGDTNEQFYEYPEPGYIFVPNYMEVRLPKNTEHRDTIQALCNLGIRGGSKHPIKTAEDAITVKYFFN